ncbi:hypothetical protein BO70DRAFT_361673 [Aspergillus heteromorphus CBS 117.55]|uniref:Uncharacterized protein n=1 Tax=Aspergillus heteromorphus CBS 117.55 TaxID=1448321 RepID=A0A317WEA7_9EURO|nr:uncharacterized protein BO70DRAFT_361673 [Aspergillus heteromorphus CBS 117.55]PWY83562.1 hypothetical protein BO70DRAFT_361673 [Aspergillus heteromorphus CBS 117.55]
MRRTFPSLRCGLLGGTAGGVPTQTDAGDMVVSKPDLASPGGIPYPTTMAKCK